MVYSLFFKLVIAVSNVILDPFSPWTTKTDAFRINNVNHREFSILSNDNPYKVIVSSTKPHSVDMEVIDGTTNEPIKSFKEVKSEYNDEGLLVSFIDNKSIKSNVVLHDEEVVVFDEVRIIKRKRG